MASGIRESSKAHQLLTDDAQFEAEAPAFRQIAFDGCLDHVGCAHVASPGHGIATADRRTMSTFV